MAIAALRAVTKSGRNIISILRIAANLRHELSRAGSLDTGSVSAQTKQATRVEPDLCPGTVSVRADHPNKTPLTATSPGATLTPPLAGAELRTIPAPASAQAQAPKFVTEFSNDAPTTDDSWDGILANLRQRYPGQKDSVLFCLHKLHSNPELGLPDFRDEARLHGIPMAGRALHSAKVILGLAQVKPRIPKPPKAPSAPRTSADLEISSEAANQPTRMRRARDSDNSGDSIENKVLDAVRQIQSAAGAEADKLRTAVREAVAILQRALDE